MNATGENEKYELIKSIHIYIFNEIIEQNGKLINPEMFTFIKSVQKHVKYKYKVPIRVILERFTHHEN